MPVHIFENSAFRIRLRLVRGKKRKAGQVTFTFIQQGGSAVIPNATVPFSKKDDEVVLQFVVPLVRDDEASYRFNYDAATTGVQLEGLGIRDYQVWPQSIKLEAVTRNGLVDTPCEGFRFRFLSAGMELGQGSTWDGGITIVGCRNRGVHTFQAVSPFQIVSWDEQHARVRKVVVSSTYQAEIVSPAWPLVPTENVQYVNLDGPAANEGHRIKVTVGALGDQGKAAHLQLGKQNDPIHVKVVFAATNSKRNDPEPALYIGGVKIDPTGNPKTCTGTVTLGADGGTADFEIELGYAGGDKCDIQVGVTRRCEDAALRVTNWRKLTLEVQAPDFLGWNGLAGAGGADAFLKAALKPAFIEYVEGPTTTFTEAEAPQHTIVETSFFNSARKLHVLGGSSVPAAKAWTSTDPRNVHVRLCDKILAWDVTYTAIKKSFDRIHTGANGFLMFEMDTMKNRYFPFPVNLEDPSQAVVLDPEEEDDAEWKADVPSSDPRPKRGSLAGWRIIIYDQKTIVLIPPDNDPVRAFITTTAAGSGLLMECNVTIKLEIRLCKEIGGNNAAGEQIYPINSQASFGLKLCHELGHAMGMAIFPGLETPPPGLAPPKHLDGGGLYYRDPDPDIDPVMVYGAGGLRGPNHKGPHCAHGVGNPAAPDLAGGKGDCIMFGEPVATTTAFCAQCLEYIKARRLTDIKSSWIGRGSSDA